MFGDILEDSGSHSGLFWSNLEYSAGRVGSIRGCSGARVRDKIREARIVPNAPMATDCSRFLLPTTKNVGSNIRLGVIGPLEAAMSKVF